jgi:hypothetical protein
MPNTRPPIPRQLERELFIEAGYRCAIPTCRAVAPLEIDHIDDWARVQEHKFDNMIVLCANCHGRKGNKRGQLDRQALRQFKTNLGLLNHRYGEFERRVLDYFAQNPEQNVILLPGGMDLLVHYLVVDGYLSEFHQLPDFVNEYSYVNSKGRRSILKMPSLLGYYLTEAGNDFVKNWKEAKPLDSTA